jgi:hypothetical protein
MPGVYDIGTAALILQPYVTVIGSGPNATTIRGSGGVSPSSSARAVVFGTANAELRSLTIEGTSPADAAIVNEGTAAPGASTTYWDVTVRAEQIPAAIVNRFSSPVFKDVTIVADSLGLRNDNATPSLTDVTIAVTNAAASSGAVGISSTGSGDVMPGAPADGAPLAAARVRMTNVTIRASGDGNSAGLVNDQSHLELANVRIEVSGSGQLRGLAATNSRLTMTDTVVRIEGDHNSEGIATTDSYVTISRSQVTVEHGKAAVEVAGTKGFLIVGHSALLHSGGSAIVKASAPTLPAMLGQTKLVGTIPSGLTCANVYDGVTYQPVVCPA